MWSADGETQRLGPITIDGSLPPIGSASVHIGKTASGGRALVCQWPDGGLPGSSVPRLAQLIESLQEERVPGLASVIHGSVGADEAAIAFAWPAGDSLEERVAQDLTSPVEALAGALNLVRGLDRAAGLGIPVGRWDPASVIALHERPAWVLLAPGIHGLPGAGARPRIDSVVEAAACAPEVATGTLDFATATLEERVASEAYALGATLFYAVTGALPLGGADPESYLRSQLGSAPRPLNEFAPALDRFRRLDEVLQRCLQRAPAARPQSYQELRDLLESALREAERLDDDAAFLPARLSDTMEIRRVRLREPEPTPRARKLPERAVQMGALLLLVAILVFLVFWQTHARSRERPVTPLTGSAAPPALELIDAVPDLPRPR
ncbi:MAG: hypothetical protein H6744_08685 [Deltaproteobacteria bacterium]|nr:hypothetical protein [Deltaproteobacteria bacterium]